MGTALKHMASAATQIVVEHIGETQAEPASTWALNLRTKAAQFKKASTKLAKWTTTGLKMGGNLSWAVGTSLMVLVVPVVLDIMRDQEFTDNLMKQEAIEQFQKQQSATIVGGAPPAAMSIPGDALPSGSSVQQTYTWDRDRSLA